METKLKCILIIKYFNNKNVLLILFINRKDESTIPGLLKNLFAANNSSSFYSQGMMIFFYIFFLGLIYDTIIYSKSSKCRLKVKKLIFSTQLMH